MSSFLSCFESELNIGPYLFLNTENHAPAFEKYSLVDGELGILDMWGQTLVRFFLEIFIKYQDEIKILLAEFANIGWEKKIGFKWYLL